GIDSVGIYDNFFDLGGHSLLATQVISQVRKAFQIELLLRCLFEFPTVAELAEHIERTMTTGQELEAFPFKHISQETDLPLSFAQQRLWFLNQLQPDSCAYNIPVAIRLTGRLNIIALMQSFNEIVHRHSVIRTTFASATGQLIQQITPTLDLNVPVVDLRYLPKVKREVEVECLTIQEAQQPFDLAQGPLLRVTLLKLTETEHVVLLTMHHIISDGWSMGIFIRELAALYKALDSGQPSPLPELPIQYADFALWQRQWLQGKVLEAQLVYWQRQLSGCPVLQLPTNRPRPAIQTFQGATQSFSLSHELTEELKTLSRQEGVTLFMTLLAVFKTLFHRYSGQDDIVVGSPIANRNRVEIEGLIGFFVNTIVLRTNLSDNPSFQELLGRMREVALGAYAHQDLPFEYLVEALQPKRNLNHNPLFQVMFVLQNAPMDELRLPELILSSIQRKNTTAKFDLSLSLEETHSGLVGILEYSTDLFDAATITRMLGHFQTLVEGIVANREQRLWELPLLTATEQHQQLVEWNKTKTDYPTDACIHHLFEAQVERTPDAVAVVFEDQQLTYQELNKRANQLAHHLQRLGVGPEVLVGIYVKRSIEMVVGLLGILKAGGAYVPLDPQLPQERLTFMLTDSQISVLVTQQLLVSELPKHNAQVLCLDNNWNVSVKDNVNTRPISVQAEHLAYVIYTSGSTGRPKGVGIKHHSSVALLTWARELFASEYFTGVLASTSICFDLSVFELFVPLSWGGKVILAENVLQLPSLSEAEYVTLLNTVPSVMTELLRMERLPASVSIVNLAGEPLPHQLVQQIYQQNTIQQVFNLYGPSEDTTYSTFAWVKQGDNVVTIGHPIANTQVYVLDKYLHPVPIGVKGELYISGDGLARGYFNHPELTAEKFIPNPLSQKPGERLYKTGDIARYLPDSNLEFLGRIDNQVKIRGYRIEPQEIEITLSQHPQVRQIVVVLREDEQGDKFLVSYVVPQQLEQVPSISALKSFLREKLPDYMVPSAFVMLETLPLTPNGKVDRRALPAPDTARPELDQAFVAPRTPIEEVLAGIWTQTLGIDSVGIYDNFFDLGGHSLLATQVI
ncbi:amino acid adenylation domain-containing protein, partial [Scytonema sp. NUACC26]|uniref:amino acid adenylation domain-containing protein n=1 Tax=Scytonema sp. NUACC26 TaxID=3140176 RepID=UPI0038B305CF